MRSFEGTRSNLSSENPRAASKSPRSTFHKPTEKIPGVQRIVMATTNLKTKGLITTGSNPIRPCHTPTKRSQISTGLEEAARSPNEQSPKLI